MRVEGRWHPFDDGLVRPVIDAAVQTPAGTWQSITLLLDAGADRTVFPRLLFIVAFAVGFTSRTDAGTWRRRWQSRLCLRADAPCSHARR